MKHNNALRMLALAAAIAAIATHASAQAAGASAAYTATASLTVDGQPVALPTFGSVSGSGGSYDDVSFAPVVAIQADLPANNDETGGTLVVYTRGIKTTAVEPGTRANAGIAHAHMAQVLIMPNPAVSADPLLSIVANTTTVAEAIGRAPKRVATATTTFTTLTVSGTLIGDPITYDGSVAPNTVLFNNGTMSIVLNATSPVGSSGISATGVTVLLNGQDIGGTTVSGTVQLNGAEAQ